MLTTSLNLLLVLGALLFPVLSTALHLAWPERQAAEGVATIFCLHMCANTLILLVVVSLSGKLDIGSIVPLRAYFILICACFLASLAIKGQAWRRRYLDGLALTVRECLVAVAVMVVSLLPALLVVRASGNHFGFATLFNGDIANYSLVADNVATAGFGNSSHILNADYGVFAAHSSSGGTSIINYISALTSLRSWQVLMAAMGYTIVLVFVTLKAVAKSVWQDHPGSHTVAACVAVMIPFSSLLVGQYFLNHLLGIAACAAAIASLISLARDESRSLVASAMLTIGLALAIYVNGTFGLPLVGACGFLVPVIHVCARDRSIPSAWRLRARMVRLACCALLALAVAGPSISAAIDTIRSQYEAQVGYPLDNLGAFGALVWPSWIAADWQHYRLPPLWQIGSWLAVLVISFAVVFRSSQRFDRRVSLLAMLGVSLAGATAIVVWGNGTYQTWKLWAFLLPFDLVIALPALWNLRQDHKGVGRMVGLVALGVSATAPMATWTTAIWAPTAGQTAQASLVASVRSVDQWHLHVVNVNLDPYLETMIAGTVLEDTQVAFTSGSYIGGPLTIQSTCTFTKISMVTDPSIGIRLAGDYILMPVPARCGDGLPWPG